MIYPVGSDRVTLSLLANGAIEVLVGESGSAPLSIEAGNSFPIDVKVNNEGGDVFVKDLIDVGPQQRLTALKITVSPELAGRLRLNIVNTGGPVVLKGSEKTPLAVNTLFLQSASIAANHVALSGGRFRLIGSDNVEAKLEGVVLTDKQRIELEGPTLLMSVVRIGDSVGKEPIVVTSERGSKPPEITGVEWREQFRTPDHGIPIGEPIGLGSR